MTKLWSQALDWYWQRRQIFVTNKGLQNYLRMKNALLDIQGKWYVENYIFPNIFLYFFSLFLLPSLLYFSLAMQNFQLGDGMHPLPPPLDMAVVDMIKSISQGLWFC